MKPLKMRMLKTVVVVMASAGALAQGTVNFSNTPSQIGGTQGRIFDIDRVTPLDGGYYAQLYMGPTPGQLRPQGTPTHFLSGAGAGYFNGGSVTVDNVAPGASGLARVMVWDSSGGASWEAALDAGAPALQSPPFAQANGGAGSPAANMVNFTTPTWTLSENPYPYPSIPRIEPEPAHLTLLSPTELRVEGTVGGAYDIQVATILVPVDWTSLRRVTLATSPSVLELTGVRASTAAFFRAVGIR